LYQEPIGPPDEWIRPLAAELSRIQQAQIGPEESLIESLDLLGVRPGEQSDFIVQSLLALRGWAGLIWQLDTRPDRQAVSARAGSLLEFLAVRLILERLALVYVARQLLNYPGPLCELRQVVSARLPKAVEQSIVHRAFLVFQLAQVLGWWPSRLIQ